jgi:predicted metal-binding membrane protein
VSPANGVAGVGVLDLSGPTQDAERNGGVPAFLPWAIAGAWLLTILAWTEGWSSVLGHDHLIEHGPGLWPALAMFLGGWQVMVAAMMLPSSLAAFRWFDGLTAGQRNRRALGAGFLTGYVAVWTGFGALAFLGDIGFHRFVDRWQWLAGRPWLIGGSVLLIAGAFELSPLARRCVTRSIQPSRRLGAYRRLVNSRGVRLGADHALRRLSRCWALTLLSFAVGMASLGWMVALTLLMVLQERKGGGRAVLLMGITLVAAAALVIAHPGWMPSLFPRAA